MADTLSDVVGFHVRVLRRQAGLSVEELATRCARAGAPKLTKDAIYFIESGRRRREDRQRTRMVTVDELVALAAALDTSPLLLLPALTEPGSMGLSARIAELETTLARVRQEAATLGLIVEAAKDA